MSAHIMAPISAGELIDKITILEIKSEKIKDAAKLANVRFELAALEELKRAAIPQSDELAALHAALKDVNAALWVIEDDIRACERAQDFGDAFIALARAVYVTNDERSKIKRDINTLLGSAIVEEKSYADYKPSP